LPDTNGKIKVLHLIHTFEIGGAQMVVLNLFKGIDKSRFELIAACMHRKGPIFDEIKSIGGKVHQFPKKKRTDFSIIPRLREYIVEEQIDILHTHNFSAGFWGRLAVLGMKSNRPKLVHTEHGRLGSISPWRKLVVCYLSKRTDRIISVSDETRDFLVSHVCLNPKNVVVIKNGIDVEDLIEHSKKHVAEIDEVLQRDPNAKFIVNVSALSAVKDQSTLLEALNILLKKIPHVYLLLVGDGPLRLELQKKTISLQIDDHVLFMGERSDVPAILDKSDVFVLSSRNEGHPISLLEAMSMGVVPVCTAVGGIPELVENTINGLTVPPGEPSLLSDAIRIPIENRKLAEEWSKNSKELISREYTAQKMAENHEKLYLEIISEGKFPNS
jgi:glycosyltransferase involved in cell wall biosynthesis